jgi:hypothetical protein
MHTLAAWTGTISWTASRKRIKQRRHAQWKGEDSRRIVRVVGYVLPRCQAKAGRPGSRDETKFACNDYDEANSWIGYVLQEEESNGIPKEQDVGEAESGGGTGDAGTDWASCAWAEAMRPLDGKGTDCTTRMVHMGGVLYPE